MSGYAVLWMGEEQRPIPGRLEFEPQALLLQGGRRSEEAQVEIPYDEIVGLRRDLETRVGRYRGIRLEVRATGTFLIASLGGVGVLSEIFATLREMLAG